MEKSVEKEYKFLVSKSKFDDVIKYIKEHYINHVEKFQINYYYDTHKNALNHLNKTVRIRQIDNKLQLQYKSHEIIRGSFVQSKEEKQIINSLPTEIYFKELDCMLFLKGNLVTQRQCFNVAETIKLCLDQNFYMGEDDYEIEIEYEELDSDKVIGLINVLGLSLQKNTISKSNRFFNRLEELSSEKSRTSC